MKFLKSWVKHSLIMAGATGVIIWPYAFWVTKQWIWLSLILMSLLFAAVVAVVDCRGPEEEETDEY